MEKDTQRHRHTARERERGGEEKDRQTWRNGERQTEI